MGLIGKIVGGAIGFALGGPLGAVAGVALGHAYDMGADLEPEPQVTLSIGDQARFTFFLAAFSMLAKLAKADNHISQEEIAAIENFMDHDLNLDPQSKQLAINIFNAAVNSKDTFQSYARQFYYQFRFQPQLLELMIDIFIRVSVADGAVSTDEERLILEAVRIFQFSESSYHTLRQKYIQTTEKYYAILGCSPDDPIEKVKKSYRKLVFEHHPDRIAAQGLPEEFAKYANDKFREIQEAYEAIKKERNFK